jgi:hypothetical protein
MSDYSGPLQIGPKVDLSEPLQEIADRLGVDRSFIKPMFIKPTEIVFTVYKKDGSGNKHLDPETLETAIQTFVREAAT